MFHEAVHPDTPLMRRSMVLLAAGAVVAAASLAPVAATAATDASGVSTAVRVMAGDGTSGELTVIDPESEEVVGRFSTPSGGLAFIYPSTTGRYLMTHHYDGEHVTILDSGLSVEDHGSHDDLKVASPFVQATVPVSPQPAHAWAHDGVLATISDSDGMITLYDEAALNDGRVETTEFMTAGPDHASMATLGDAMLVAYYGLGHIDAFSLDGELLAENVIDCAGAHGDAHLGDAAVFGCEDGLAVVTTDGESFEAVKIPNPPEAVGAMRVSMLGWDEDSDVIIGNMGEGVVLISADGEDMTWNVLPLSGSPVAWPQYGADGTIAAVLTGDGSMHGIDMVAGEVLWSTPALSVSGDSIYPLPLIGTSSTDAYVADPGTGEVLELDLASGEITGRFEVGGQPARVTVTEASGVVH